MSTQNPKVNNEAIQQKDGSKKSYSKNNLIDCVLKFKIFLW